MKPKGDIPHIRYLLDKKTHLAYRRLMKTLNNSLVFESSSPAQFRLHIIEYADIYGVKATLEAFKLKRSTFYLWKKRYLASNKKLISLVPRSTRPHSVRKMEMWELEFIKEANHDLTEWLVEYSFIRPHETLDYLTPIEYAHTNYF